MLTHSLHDKDHVRHSRPAAVIGAHITHSVRSARRRTHKTLTPEQHKSTGTDQRVILRTEVSDRFRRHSE